ncbi:MAG TPA: HD-GYP domain-containing protein [Gemmatimonadaceae bacterium]|nr:HD-GYP domain-containing protein [Gemmatimonadaceae bacterium]
MVAYLAMVLTVGNWMVPLAIAAVKAVSEVRTKAPIKAIFNVAQIGLSAAVAVLMFKTVGGTPLVSLGHATLLEATVATGLPALLAILASSFVNGVLVSGVIAISTGRHGVEIWRESFKVPLAFDLIIGPVIFVFSWVYVSWGPIGAVALWVPILGLRQISKTNSELEQINRELLELMVKSIEARDPYTSGHSRRVHHYSVIIARALGRSPREIERVGQAALLHDIGKIHEKYAPILKKEDRLTPEEWQIMQQHPADGAELIATMSGLKDLVAPVRHHHENWDGSGYPDGLAGERIPLMSRIIMFADTIDAMTSERPYRLPMQPEQVRHELVRCRGKQFDPQIADRVLAASTWTQLFGPLQKVELVERGTFTVWSRTKRKIG